MQTSNRDAPEIAEQAAELVLRLEGAEEGVQPELSDSLWSSPRDLREFMLSIAIHQQIRKMGAAFQAKTRQARAESASGRLKMPGRFGIRAGAASVAAGGVCVVAR